MLQPRNASQTSSARPSRMPKRPIPSHPLQERSTADWRLPNPPAPRRSRLRTADQLRVAASPGTLSGSLFDGSPSLGTFRQVCRPEAFVIDPVEIQRVADAEIVIMAGQPVLCGFSSPIPEMGEKGPFGIELAGYAECQHGFFVVNGVDMHVAEALALEVLVMDDFPKKGERTQLLEQARIEGDLV